MSPSALTQAGSTKKWRKIRKAILDRDGWMCAYCGGPADTVDHVIPRAEGGGDESGNLVAACKPCNYSRPKTRRPLQAPHITVVTGGVGVGKSIWVKSQAQRGDPILDFDDLARALGSPTRSRDATGRWSHPPAIEKITYQAWRAARQAMMRTPARHAYIIQAYPSPKDEKMYNEAGCSIVAIDPAHPPSSRRDPAPPSRRGRGRGRAESRRRRFFRGAGTAPRPHVPLSP